MLKARTFFFLPAVPLFFLSRFGAGALCLLVEGASCPEWLGNGDMLRRRRFFGLMRGLRWAPEGAAAGESCPPDKGGPKAATGSGAGAGAGARLLPARFGVPLGVAFPSRAVPTSGVLVFLVLQTLLGVSAVSSPCDWLLIRSSDEAAVARAASWGICLVEGFS